MSLYIIYSENYYDTGFNNIPLSFFTSMKEMYLYCVEVLKNVREVVNENYNKNYELYDIFIMMLEFDYNEDFDFEIDGISKQDFADILNECLDHGFPDYGVVLYKIDTLTVLNKNIWGNEDLGENGITFEKFSHFFEYIKDQMDSSDVKELEGLEGLEEDKENQEIEKLTDGMEEIEV